jgi:hypothetical protein
MTEVRCEYDLQRSGAGCKNSSSQSQAGVNDVSTVNPMVKRQQRYAIGSKVVLPGTLTCAISFMYTM